MKIIILFLAAIVLVLLCALIGVLLSVLLMPVLPALLVYVICVGVALPIGHYGMTFVAQRVSHEV